MNCFKERDRIMKGVKKLEQRARENKMRALGDVLKSVLGDVLIWSSWEPMKKEIEERSLREDGMDMRKEERF